MGPPRVGPVRVRPRLFRLRWWRRLVGTQPEVVDEGMDARRSRVPLRFDLAVGTWRRGIRFPAKVLTRESKYVVRRLTSDLEPNVVRRIGSFTHALVKLLIEMGMPHTKQASVGLLEKTRLCSRKCLGFS